MNPISEDLKRLTIVNLNLIGWIWVLYQQAIAILIWIRVVYTYLYTDPDRNNFLDFMCMFYYETGGQELAIGWDKEHPNLKAIQFVRRYYNPHLDKPAHGEDEYSGSESGYEASGEDSDTSQMELDLD